MRTLIATSLFLGSLMLAGIADAQIKTLRAREMSSEQWANLTKQGNGNTIVEFRQGDEIPVTFSSEGDLLETNQVGVSYVKVKRGFWLKMSQNDVQMSLDGVQFKALKDVIEGSFVAGAGANQPGVPVNAIDLMLKAYLK